MKTGVSTSIIVDVNKQRNKNHIKPLKCNCRSCLYFDGKLCKFNKTTENRRYCIKYEYSNPSLIEKQKKPKSIKKEEPIERIIKKTTFDKLSQLLGVRITFEALQERYRSYSKGYSMKIYKTEPLTIVLRHNNTKKKFYYEII